MSNFIYLQINFKLFFISSNLLGFQRLLKIKNPGFFDRDYNALILFY